VQATKVKVAMAENSTVVCWFFLIRQSNESSTQLLCTQLFSLSTSMTFSRAVGKPGPEPFPGNIDNDMDVLIVPDLNYVCAARAFSVDSYCGCYHFDTPAVELFALMGDPGPVAIRAPTNSSFIYVLTRFRVLKQAPNETIAITTLEKGTLKQNTFTEGLSVFEGPINSISAVAATDGSGRLLYAAASTAGGRYAAWHDDNITLNRNPPNYASAHGAIASDVVFMSDSARFCYVFVNNSYVEFQSGNITDFSSNWVPSKGLGFVNTTRAQLGLARDQSYFGVLLDAPSPLAFRVRATDGWIMSNITTFVAFLDRVDQIFTLNDAVRSRSSSPSFCLPLYFELLVSFLPFIA